MGNAATSGGGDGCYASAHSNTAQWCGGEKGDEEESVKAGGRSGEDDWEVDSIPGISLLYYNS